MFENLYTVSHKKGNETTVTLNVKHKIFEVHFKGNPILPGACLTEISRQIIEKQENRKLNIVQIKNLKFVSLISPIKNPELLFVTETTKNGSGYSSKITVSNTEKSLIFTKMTMDLE